MPEPSILFEPGSGPAAAAAEPAWFRDLNLDQFLAAVCGDPDRAHLRPFFWSFPASGATVRYRQDVVKDLDSAALLDGVRAFAEGMRRTQRLLGTAGRIRERHYRQGWILDAAEAYCATVTGLTDLLGGARLGAAGWTACREYVTRYRAGAEFRRLEAAVSGLRLRLQSVHYTVEIRGERITVDRYSGQPDYSAAVLATFARFREGGAKDYRTRYPEREMNHVQARILDIVAEQHPDVFTALDGFCTSYADRLVDPVLDALARDVGFYLAYLDYVAPLAAAGLPLCLPEVADQPGPSRADGAYDVVLAQQRVAERGPVVPNDFRLDGAERVLVVTGPNQGGKTTFARMFGQLHHLAALGLPVPARAARVQLADQIFTHFERIETIATGHGKLEDELVRVREILAAATARSVVVLNETFASTTLEDAVFLGRRILGRLAELGPVGVYVTFVDELASVNPATVSMVAGVDPADPARRTFRIDRRPADGCAYASAIAAKYGLTRAAITERIRS